MKSTLLLCLLFPAYCFSQDDLNMNGINCSIHGSSKTGSKTYFLNELKNRYNLPGSNEIDSGISIQNLISSGDPNQFPTNKAVRIKGYVFNVKTGGVETCNCRSKEQNFRDTHIELTPDKDHTGPESRIIIEVTPRLRQLMAKNGIDWTTSSLKRTIIGKNIVATGWLLYDFEHEDGSFANDPDDNAGRPNWRASCWEVHPVTSIKIEGQDEYDVPKSNNKDIETKSNDNINDKIPSNSINDTYTKDQGNNKGIFIFMGILIIILIVIISMLYKKTTK